MWLLSFIEEVYMNDFIFSLNAVMPVFLTMLSGIFFRKIGWVNKNFASMLNSFVFKAALPVLLFQDLSSVDFGEVWDTSFVCFCFLATLAGILAVTCLSFAVAPRECRGEFVQASYRSSAAIIGIAFMQNIYGSSEMGALMILATVPLYNIGAVLVLTLLHPDQKKLDKAALIRSFKGIVTNPIILGIAAGVLWSAFGPKQPAIMTRTLKNIASVATPLGLIALGASFEQKSALKTGKIALLASIIKLVALTAIFLPVAVALGFREQKLIAILVMLGSATTVSSFVMAQNMGYEGTLTSGTVLITTLCSSVTLTLWLFLLRVNGWV